MLYRIEVESRFNGERFERFRVRKKLSFFNLFFVYPIGCGGLWAIAFAALNGLFEYAGERPLFEKENSVLIFAAVAAAIHTLIDLGRGKLHTDYAGSEKID